MRFGLALCATLAGLVLDAQAPSAQELPPAIAESKSLKIAINAGYPPMEYRDASGELVGFDIDLSRALGKVLGVEIEYVDGAFEQMTPSLQSGRVDLILSGFYDTPKRRDMFDFIDYLKAGAQFYTLDSLTEITTPTDLCGRIVTTSRGTSFPDTVKAFSDTSCVAAGKPAIEIIIDTDLGQQITNLKTERAQAAVQGLEGVPTITAANPGMRALGEPMSTALIGIAFNKTDTQLRDAFVFALKKVIEDGTYDALIEKWKLDLSVYKDVTLNMGPQP